jgi:hypothetical protein
VNPTPSKTASINRTAAEARRRRVAELRLRRMTQRDIASVIGCAQGTVAKDLKVIESEWRREAVADIAAHRARALAEIDEMEKEAAIRYVAARNNPEFFKLRLECQKRRAALLGLDAPKQLDLSGSLRIETLVAEAFALARGRNAS